MENKLTAQMIKDAVELLKKHEVKGDYILRIHPSRIDEAYELGLTPFCPLTDDNFIECEYHLSKDGTYLMGEGCFKPYNK